MQLNDVHQGIHGNKGRKRIGRGTGSRRGKTATRGHKGDGSRSGYHGRLVFEGGQMPFMRKVAKRGFSNNYFTKRYAVVNVATLEDAFENGAVVDEASLRAVGLVKGQWDGVKILGDGELTKKLTVKVGAVSQGAQAKITAAGGSVELQLL